MKVPLLDLRLEYEYIKADIDSAIDRCLEHQRWILGPEVDQLQSEVSEYLGTDYAVGVSSGTDALVIALRAICISRFGREFFQADQEIITTTFSFTATGDAILRAGARPVFVDIDPATYNIDVSRIREFLDKNESKVVGILPVHLYGQSCDMDTVMALADEYGLFVLEDVAQAFGAEYKGKKCASIGDAGSLSFFPSKNLGGFGDGGMVVTSDQDIADAARILIKHGGRDKYNVDHVGYNARLDTLQAAVLSAKLMFIDEFNDRRRSVADCYNENLKGLCGLEIPIVSEEARHVYHQYTVRIADRRRDEVVDELTKRKIATAVYYPVCLHQMKVFDEKTSATKDLGRAQQACSEVLSLPIEPLLTDEQKKYVCDSLREILR